MNATCHNKDSRRVESIENSVNGIDYVSTEPVALGVVASTPDRPFIVTLHCFKNLSTEIDTPLEFILEIRDLQQNAIANFELPADDSAESDTPPIQKQLTIKLTNAHVGRTYRVQLKLGENNEEIDPAFASAEFAFFHRDDRTTKVDPEHLPSPAQPVRPEPEINYLAKDFQSFRKLILDRMSRIMPDWQEHHAADVGMTLVELLAYKGDQLSYHQDAVATEAYLETARRRISVRRHARLVDYQIHEGANALGLVQLQVTGNFPVEPKQVFFITRPPDVMQIKDVVVNENALPDGWQQAVEVFEQVENVFDVAASEKATITCSPVLNEIHFYTWGETECWLPKGATSATLKANSIIQNCSSSQDSAADLLEDVLEDGDILIFEEVLGPKTGLPADADPHHRQAVRLTKVGKEAKDPVTGTKLVEIEWSLEDALKFPLCLSSRSSPSPAGHKDGCRDLGNISVARGNVVPLDHGQTVQTELIGTVSGNWMQTTCATEWDQPRWVQQRDTFSPVLREPDLTAVRRLDGSSSVSSLYDSEPHQATPSITLEGFPAVPVTGQSIPLNRDIVRNADELLRLLERWYQHQRDFAYAIEDLLSPETASLLNAKFNKPKKDLDEQELQQLRDSLVKELTKQSQWTPVNDLIDSRPEDRHFVVEMDNQRRTHIRFGDGENGRRPDIGMTFYATYRIGNGIAGNVGTAAITNMVTRNGIGREVVAVSNSLPTSGGIDPESIKEVKIQAPNQFRARQDRAILAKDYEEIVMRGFHHRLQAVRADIKPSSDHTHRVVSVVVDTLASKSNLFGGQTDDLKEKIKTYLNDYRRMQHKVVVHQGQKVPITLTIKAELASGALRSEVYRDLSDLFSSRDAGYGKKGLFHPDRLTFGQPIYVSELVSAARQIAGVINVVVPHLSREGGSNVARGETSVQTGENTFDPEGPNDNGTGENILMFQPTEIAHLVSRVASDRNGTTYGAGSLVIQLKGGK